MARSSKKKPGKKGGKKKGSVRIDMEGVESGGRAISDGWAAARIVESELTESESSGNEMFKVVMECTRGKEKAKVWDNLVLTQSALWKIKSLLEAAGVEVPEGEMDVSADDLLDLEFDVEIVNELYEGRDRPRVAAFATLGTHTGDEDDDDDSDDDDDEDEKPSKKSKKGKSKKSSDDDEDDEDEEDEDDDSDDDDDSDEDDDEDSDDDDEDDDEEEDEPPKKKGKGKPSKKSKKSDDDDEDEDDDSDDDEDDDSDDDEDDSDDDEDDEDEDDEDEKPAKKGKKGKASKSKSKLRAGTKVSFEHKGKTKQGVVTSIDDDTVFVEDKKGVEWELAEDEITVIK